MYYQMIQRRDNQCCNQRNNFAPEKHLPCASPHHQVAVWTHFHKFLPLPWKYNSALEKWSADVWCITQWFKGGNQCCDQRNNFAPEKYLPCASPHHQVAVWTQFHKFLPLPWKYNFVFWERKWFWRQNATSCLQASPSWSVISVRESLVKSHMLIWVCSFLWVGQGRKVHFHDRDLNPASLDGQTYIFCHLVLSRKPLQIY